MCIISCVPQLSLMKACTTHPHTYDRPKNPNLLPCVSPCMVFLLCAWMVLLLCLKTRTCCPCHPTCCMHGHCMEVCSFFFEQQHLCTKIRCSKLCHPSCALPHVHCQQSCYLLPLLLLCASTSDGQSHFPSSADTMYLILLLLYSP